MTIDTAEIRPGVHTALIGDPNGGVFTEYISGENPVARFASPGNFLLNRPY